jgi:hypothetical protein
LNNLVKINNQDLQVKEYKGQRVVTLKDIDLLHERVDGTAGRNFRENRKHFIEGIDYFQRNSSEAKLDFNVIAPNGLTLITESGYLMLVKSFTDDLAWEVQRQLVTTYFRAKEIAKADNMKVISLLHAEVGELIAATTQIESRVESLENTMTIDYAQQLVLQEIAKAVAIQSMGGKDTTAYRDSSLRASVFAAVWKDYKEYFQVNSYKNTARVDFEKAKEYLKNWKAQGKILRGIEDSNNQIILMNEA